MSQPVGLWLDGHATVVISRRGKQLIAESPGQSTTDRPWKITGLRALVPLAVLSRRPQLTLGYVTGDYVTRSGSHGQLGLHGLVYDWQTHFLCMN